MKTKKLSISPVNECKLNKNWCRELWNLVAFDLYFWFKLTLEFTSPSWKFSIQEFQSEKLERYIILRRKAHKHWVVLDPRPSHLSESYECDRQRHFNNLRWTRAHIQGLSHFKPVSLDIRLCAFVCCVYHIIAVNCMGWQVIAKQILIIQLSNNPHDYTETTDRPYVRNHRITTSRASKTWHCVKISSVRISIHFFFICIGFHTKNFNFHHCTPTNFRFLITEYWRAHRVWSFALFCTQQLALRCVHFASEIRSILKWNRKFKTNFI